MRTVILILILAVVAAIVAIQAGLVDVSMTRPATAPTVSAENGRIEAKGGQAPAFDVETGTVAVGKTEKTVNVPVLEVRPPDGSPQANVAAATTNR